MTKRKRVRRTVESWELDTGKPGLVPRSAESAGIELVLAEEVVATSAAVHEPGTDTWRPAVLLEVTGRYNQTAMPAHVVIAINDQAAAVEIAHSIIAAAERATADAAAGMLEDRP